MVEIDFWSLFTGGDGQIMNEIVARFNEEHPNIKVTHTILDWGDPYYSKLITSTVAGRRPQWASCTHLASRASLSRGFSPP